MEKQEMKEKDAESNEKIDNKNPNDSLENHITIQEYHHARHALYFFYFGTYSVIHGKTAWCTQEKVERIRFHLNCLKEFISENTPLEEAVNTLLECLGRSEPCDHKEWGQFLFRNWTWIRKFAAHYGEDEKCFPQEYHEKLKDVLNA